MESPIEEAMLIGIAAASSALFFHTITESFDEIPGVIVTAGMSPKLALVISPQTQIGPYRVDFLLARAQKFRDFENVIFRAIECDGHDYHERTKEQAAKDKARDRYLLRCGVTTMRFTGSEIYNNALSCGFEAIEVFAEAWMKEYDKLLDPYEEWRASYGQAEN